MDDVHLRRRLTAVLLADVVGYSRLMSADEQGTHRRLAGYVKDLIEPAVVRHRGRPVRNMGDGMLVEFDSALDAVQCAVDIQHGLAACQSGDTQRPIQLRIGINTGDVIVDERDIYGNSINIAARLEALAEPGQIYVTRGVRDQLLGYPGFAFQNRGRRRVKNIDQPIQVFRIEHDPAAQLQSDPRGLRALVLRWWHRAFRPNPRSAAIAVMLIAIAAMLGLGTPPMWRGSVPLPPRASIVVMPFNNFSGDTQQSYIADAITDDLTTDLAQLKGIFVIARGTAFTFKGKSVDAREVGRECNVRYLLEGSIIRDGTRLETNVQLIDTATGAHIWADRFQSDMSDLFKLLSAVTGRIAASLELQLHKAEGARAMQQPASDPDAVDLRFRAMSLYISGITPEHTLEARRLLEQSVQLDPNSAESWAWLADLLASDYLNRWNNPTTEQLDRAEHAVRKALTLDPDMYLAYFARGYVHRARGENAAAVQDFDESVRLNPNFAHGYVQKASELINLGMPDQAPPLVEMAISLSPRDPGLGVFYWSIGRAHFFVAKYAEAIPWLQKAVDTRPNLWYNWAYLISAQALVGHLDEARQELTKFRRNQYFANQRFTISYIKQLELAVPSTNPVIRQGREKLHDGLRIAGMADD